jgi:WD40 repeat protein
MRETRKRLEATFNWRSCIAFELQLRGHTTGVLCLDTTANLVASGPRVLCRCVAASRDLLTGSSDKSIRVWNADTGRCLQAISVGRIVTQLRFLSERCIIAAVGTLNRGISCVHIKEGLLQIQSPI